MSGAVPWLDRLAHDLRGPLTPLQTASYLLRSGQVDAERQRELLAVIDRQTRQLARMIDELGDWTRVGQERLLGPRERCEPSLLLDYARGNSGVASMAITVEDEAGTGQVEGDPVRLTQLLRTLIEFASARSDGAPRISLRLAGDRLRVDVRDAGLAPDPAQLALLFEEPQPHPFDEGLGLRLLIARAIAEAHGGSLVANVDAGHMLLRCELPLADA